MPRTSYLLNPEQRAYLRAIGIKARRLRKQEAANKVSREQFDQMIVTAKAMGIPYTRISREAGLSPERLSQIDREKNR